MYKRYLAEESKGSQAKAAREFITALEQRIRADETRKAEEARKAEAARVAEEARKAEEARVAEEARKAQEARDAEDARKAQDGQANDPDVHRVPEGPVDSGEGGGGGMRLGGMVVGGAGVLALGAGVFYGMKAKSISNELSEPGAPFTDARDDEGKAANQTMIIATAAGGALIVGGAVLYFMGRSKGKRGESTAIAPMIVRDGGGLTVRGGF